MKRTILTLTLAAQMAAGTAFAQATAPADTQTGGNGTTSQTFGNDWPTTLGLALFDTDGETVRVADEISMQWETLSDDDKDMIRRDCDMLPDQAAANGTTGTTGSAGMTDTTSGTGAMTDTGTHGADATADVGAGSARSAGDTSPLSDTATADTSAGTAMTSITVSETQMQDICDATSDL